MTQMILSYCSSDQKRACVYWVEKYFKDCLCNLNDEISFGLGFISLVCWGVAEIPQIITNFSSKSGHGVSLVFLLTWVIGDIFNIVGCLLEPATLPTQLYTALLYTTSTVVLVLQCIYYDYICKWWKRRTQNIQLNLAVDEHKEPLKPKSVDSSISIPRDPLKAYQRSDPYYIMSARSLAGSHTPPIRSSLGTPRSGSSAIERNDEWSSEDETVPAAPSEKPVSQPLRIPRSAGYGTFLATSVTFPFQGKALMEGYTASLGRKLLQEPGVAEHNVYGQWLGWMMAAIYMGGRIPQIWLNIKRGSVEGLNPLMFIFALIANVTYVGSILVRSIEWEKIKANMPWLIDAAVCVVLDLFIIVQYIYYKTIERRMTRDAEEYGDYVAAKKAVIS